MKLPISALIRFLPVLLGVILAVSTMACSDGSNERLLSSPPDPTGTNPTTSPQDTPVPTRFAAATPSLTQGESRPTSTATARPTPAVAIPAQATPTAILPTVSPSEPATTGSEAANSLGGTLNLVSSQVAPHSDVHMEVSAALAAWGPGIAYGRLLRFRSGDGVELPSLSVECEVCIGWEMTDGTTFEFRLRDDVMWQDLQPVNGRQLVAEDIAYSYERQRSEGMPNGALLNIVDSVEVESQDLLRVNIFAPDADFLGALADG
ncbi:MAG: ABC transporter substrate-binding protein, partial [Chloroflexi bacterium]|nr:ABC transporter substrate-binding protein [Chloroflexota bacterium]